VWDDEFGLLLSVSIKTYSFADWHGKKQAASRYTRNIKRNDFELHSEADVIHRRQPYAVLAAVLFMPGAACDDGDSTRASDIYKSSFAHAVVTLRHRAGRLSPEDRFDRFEKVFIGLYEHEGDFAGAVSFFDVESSPPRNGRPQRKDLLSLSELARALTSAVDVRNDLAPSWSEPDDEGE
jgi:hypothetical protein